MSFLQNNFKVSSGTLHTAIKILDNFDEVIDINTIKSIESIFNSQITYALYFLERCQYLKFIRSDYYVILKRNNVVSYEDKFKELIRDYIINFKPIWTERIKWGMLSFVKDLDSNEEHCLNEVHLLDFQKIDNLIWWNRLPFFEDINLRNREVGLIGEYLSIQYETERVKSVPLHISLLGGIHGCDVLSKLTENSDRQKFIECKTTVLGESTIIHITNNEWKKAIEKKNEYFFHIWKLDLNRKSAKMIEVSVIEMQEHIPLPSQSNLGVFEDAVINLTSVLQSKVPMVNYENLTAFEDLLQGV